MTELSKIDEIALKLVELWLKNLDYEDSLTAEDILEGYNYFVEGLGRIGA